MSEICICFTCNKKDNPEEGTIYHKWNQWNCLFCLSFIELEYFFAKCLYKKRKNIKNKDSDSNVSDNSENLSSVDNFVKCSSEEFSDSENISVDLFGSINKITNKFQQKAIVETNTKYFELLRLKENNRHKEVMKDKDIVYKDRLIEYMKLELQLLKQQNKKSK